MEQFEERALLASDLGISKSAVPVVDPDGAGPLAPVALPIVAPNVPAGAVNAGGYIRYDVPFGNSGPDNAIDALITDQISGNTTFVGALATGGAFVPAAQPPAVPFTFTIQAVDTVAPLGPNISLTCTVFQAGGSQSIYCRPQGNDGLADGTLPDDYVGTLTYFVKVNESVAGGTVISNAANIASGLCPNPAAPGPVFPPSDCASSDDPNTGNNTSVPTQTVVVASSSLSVSKIVQSAVTAASNPNQTGPIGPATPPNGAVVTGTAVLPGTFLTYRILVTNNGPSDAANIRLTDVLPSGLESPPGRVLGVKYIAVSPVVPSGATFTCDPPTGVNPSFNPDGNGGSLVCTAPLLSAVAPNNVAAIDVTVFIDPATKASLVDVATVDATVDNFNRPVAGSTTLTTPVGTTVNSRDEFEPNDTIATAIVLGSLPEVTLRNLTIHQVAPGVSDQDYFQITAHDTGKLLVNTQFTNTNGNTNLEIVDARGNVIASSLNADPTADENIVIPVVSQQRYFVHVFGVTGATSNYSLEIENFSAPVPEDVDLDRNDDSGASYLDDVTFRTTLVHYYFHVDLNDFANEGIPILTAAQAAGGVTPGAAVQVFDNGVSVGFASAVPGTDNTLFDLSFDADLTRFAIGGPNAAGPLGYLGFSNFVEAAVKIFDGQKNAGGLPAPATGRTQLGDRLAVINDNIAPLAPSKPDLLPSSDSGQFNNDNVTLFNALALQGTGEANAHVVIRANGLVVGQGTVDTDATDGVLGNGLGTWEITTEPLTPANDAYVITATLEDLAGNIGAPSVALYVLIDPEGPQVTNVFITGSGPSDPKPYNLFGDKPDVLAPTPAVNSLTIRLQDLPNRDTVNFPTYLALDPNVSKAPGNFLLIGDANGVIPIKQVIVTNDPLVNGQPATATIQLIFDKPLPDDRFTFTIKDSVGDPAWNGLDGESNAAEPSGAPAFPSGNGLPGGDFVARFTVDTRAEIGAWSSGSIYVDTNGNYVFDPTNTDFTNRDITYLLGFTSDNIFAGNFVAAANVAADGFDKLGAYGKVGNSFRWLIDTNNDGLADINNPQPLVLGMTSVNGMPAAGNFDGNAANGDEVVLKVGNTWLIDTHHDFAINANDLKLVGNMTGLPIVGDFDGDGKQDLGAWADNKFSLNLSTLGPINGNTSTYLGKPLVINFGFASVRERPVAANFDADRFDDLGLWVPDRSGVAPSESAEWYLLISGDQSIKDRIVLNTAGTFDIFFKPTPFGNDRYAQFGDEFGLPLVGNFDPPVVPTLTYGSLTNIQDFLDVDNDGVVTPTDALLVINWLHANPGDGQLPSAFLPGSNPFLDVDGDLHCTPTDSLLVINWLNNNILHVTPPAEVEGEANTSTSDAYFAALPSATSDLDLLFATLAGDQELNKRK